MHSRVTLRTVATAHERLTRETATPNDHHRAWGADVDDALVAMTFVHPGPVVSETDFTVVAPEFRGLGMATAVKAASLLALSHEGHRDFRAGGSADNPRIIAANTAIGYVIDKWWATLRPPSVG